MKIDFTDISYDSRPYEYRGATLYIRPYPESLKNVSIHDGRVVIAGEERWRAFDYSLERAEKLVDANGQAASLADDVRVGSKTMPLKRVIFDFNLNEIPVFVARTSGLTEAKKQDEEKNS